MLFALIPPPAMARAANAEEGDEPGDKTKAGDGAGADDVLSTARNKSSGSDGRGRGAG